MNAASIAALVLLLMTTFAGASGLAQHRATTADIRVAARDQLGGILRDVDVSVTNFENGLVRKARTGVDGMADIPALAPGTYLIEAAAPMFAAESRQVRLALGTVVEVVFTLGVLGKSEHITVLAEVSDAESQAGANVISLRRIDALPTNSRNFISFALTTPGVHSDRIPQQGASATSGLSFAGQRARSNNITVDGLDNNDSALGSVRATFSQEAVQEFQVLAASYPAEFGKASGGVLNIVTRSGANRTSASAFLYLRHDALNARHYFEKHDPAGNRVDRPKAPYSQAQSGGTLGGAIQRDKTFYFLSFERLDSRAANFVTIDDNEPVFLGPVSLGTPAQILRNAGFAVSPGNVPYRAQTESFLLKADHRFSPRQNLALRFNYGSALDENSETWGGLVGRSRGAALESGDRAIAGSHIWIGSRGLVHEFRVQYARRRQNVFSLDPKCGGACTDDQQGGPTIEVTGYAFLGRHRFTPQPRSSQRWQWVDTLSVQSGRHLFKAGFDASLIHNRNERLPLHFGGRYIFAASLPGALFGLPYENINAIQAVALGLPSAYIQGYGNPRASYAVADASVFLQDEWRPARSLTFGLGARYQRQFWQGAFPGDNNNVAPRLSAVWSVRRDGQTRLHSAYGLFFENQLTMLPAVTRILDGGEAVRTLAVQLPSPLLTAAWNAADRRLPEAQAGGYASMKFVIDPRLRTPFAHHFTTGLNHHWIPGIATSISFVVARGHAQLGTVDYNPMLPDLGPGRRPDDIGGVAGTSASILQFTSFGRTWHRGLNVSVHARQYERFELSAGYTLSSTQDTSTDYQSAFIPQNNGRGRTAADPDGLPLGFDAQAEKGFSVQDQRHRLVVSGVYDLPWDMAISGLLNAGTGRPYSVLAGADLNGDGNGGAFPTDRARREPSLESTSLPRNTGRLPGNFTIDTRISRTFDLRRGMRLEAMLELFNVLNRTNYTDVNNVFGSGPYPDRPLPAYGQYTQAGPMRQAQIALKLRL